MSPVDFHHTGWHCSKCGKELIQRSDEPPQLQPTLDSRQRRAKCLKCNAVRLFRHSSQM